MPTHHRPRLGHPRLQHGPRHQHDWFLSAEEVVDRKVFAGTLASIAAALRDGGLSINDVKIEIPEFVEFHLKYERTPHGARAFMLRAEWDDDGGTQHVPAGGLRIGPSSVDAVA